MIAKTELVRWASTLPNGDGIFVDEGGLTLHSLKDPEAYLEVGGKPDASFEGAPRRIINGLLGENDSPSDLDSGDSDEEERDATHEVDCPYCHGHGYLEAEGGRRYTCQDCGGSGSEEREGVDPDFYADDQDRPPEDAPGFR